MKMGASWEVRFPREVGGARKLVAFGEVGVSWEVAASMELVALGENLESLWSYNQERGLKSAVAGLAYQTAGAFGATLDLD